MSFVEFSYLILEYLKAFIIALRDASNFFNPLRNSPNSRQSFAFWTAPCIATRPAGGYDLFFLTRAGDNLPLISATFKSTVFSSFQQCFNLFMINKRIKREYPRTIVLSSMSLARTTNHTWFILLEFVFRCPLCKQVIQASSIKCSLGGIQSFSSTSHFTINQMSIPLLLLTTLTTINNHPTRVVGTFATSGLMLTYRVSILTPCFRCSRLFRNNKLVLIHIIIVIIPYSEKDLFISRRVHKTLSYPVHRHEEAMTNKCMDGLC
mmetsp:Transcript_14831/g.24284  ORF Transcript_14831/g.24284 Transcript_14831/m.24284 type:complete len:264 (-) Transcript_14831:334-1125(-)